MSIARTLLSLLLLLGVPALAAAQNEPPPIFDEVVEVNVVGVDVIVLDENDEPVTGLTIDDFQIFEDKDAMEISNFYEVRDGRNVAGPAPSVVAEAPVEDPKDQKPQIDLESRTFVLFFDNSSLEKKNRKRVMQASRDFVRDHMGEGDFVKVVMLGTGGNLNTLQGFTSSPGDVVYAIDQLEQTKVDGNMVNNNTRQLLRDLVVTQTGMQQPVGGPGSFGAALDINRVQYAANMMRARILTEVRRTWHRSEQSLAALEYLMRPLAGVPGQKAVVYFGEGLPTRPGETLFQAFYNKFANIAELYPELTIDPPEVAALDFDLNRRFSTAVAKAQESGVRFYAVDAAGRRPSFRGTAEYGLTDSVSIAGSGYQDIWNASLDTQRDRNLRGGLERIAAETGATTLADSRDYSGFFDRIDRDLNNFYSLGYQPPRERDGRFHSIRVETTNPKYKVLHRSQYQNKTAEQSLVDLALAELLTDASNNPLDLWLEAGQASRSKDKKYVLPIDLKFPMERATLLPTGDRRVGQLTAVVVVRDEIGDTSPPQKIPLAVEVQDDQTEAGKIPVAVASLRLVLREGKQVVAVAVRDRLSGITSSESVTVVVSPPSSRRGR